MQDALKLHVLVTLKKNAEVQALLQEERFQKSLDQHRDIVRLISESDDVSSHQMQILLHQQHKSDRMSRRQLARTMAAIQQLPARIKFKQTMAGFEHLRLIDPAHSSRVAHMKAPDQAQIKITPQQEAQARANVLDNLKYRQMKLREFEVSEAHQETFQWVYDKQPSEPGNDFGQWLRDGSGCYWINGKAASGKSTLMKYVVGNRQTESALRQWAGDSYLLTLSFFFWYSGTLLQRSQEGLFRSILFEILSKHEMQIPNVFPELYAEEIAQQRRPIHIQPLSGVELKVAFLRLLEVLPAAGRVCLFIDGIDEYDGDHEEICDLFKSIAIRPTVKVVLSSRPILACVEAFKHSKGLRLEDLTRKDIEKYVCDTLGSQARMRELRLDNPQSAQDLVDHIVSKASGVFLWVILVVRSLISGLKNYDRISDLQRRLDDLPQELEDLYKHMLSSIIPLYRRQASQLLQIKLQHFMTESEEPLTVLQLSFAAEEDAATSIRLSDKGLTGSQLSFRIKSTYGQLLSRCCGLLEVSGVVTHDAPVSFLHKSVVDFLKMPGVEAFLVQLGDPSRFDVNIALMSSNLALLKIIRKDWQWQERVILDQDEAILALMRRVQTFLTYCKSAERSSGQGNTIYIEECDKTMARGWSHVVHVEKVKPCLANCMHWAVVMSIAFPSEQYRSVDSLVALAASHGLGKFIRDMSPKNSTAIRTDTSDDLLVQTIRGISRKKSLLNVEDSCELVQSLILHGANVNHKGSWMHSAWETAFFQFHKVIDLRDNELFPDLQLALCRMLLYLLDHGGDLQAKIQCRTRCPLSGRSLADERSILCIVEEALQVFSSCRVSGIQQLLTAVTVLRDQLCYAGAESIVPFSRSSFQTPTRQEINRRSVESEQRTYSGQLDRFDDLQSQVSPDSQDEPSMSFESDLFEHYQVSNNRLHQSDRQPRSANSSVMLPRLMHNDGSLSRISGRSRKASATFRFEFRRLSDFIYSTNLADFNSYDHQDPESITRILDQTKLLCSHRRPIRECPLGCGHLFNPPPDGF